jgi:hypothetical protein
LPAADRREIARAIDDGPADADEVLIALDDAGWEATDLSELGRGIDDLVARMLPAPIAEPAIAPERRM